MENWKDRTHFLRQLQLVSHGTLLLQNLVRSYISRRKLASYSKTLNFLRRIDFEINIVTNFKLKRPSPLMRLRSFHLLWNDSDTLLGFFGKLNTIVSSFTRFNLVQWGSTLAAIQSFKRCHLYALLINVIVRELN